jgi:hypothetical protein
MNILRGSTNPEFGGANAVFASHGGVVPANFYNPVKFNELSA